MHVPATTIERRAGPAASSRGGSAFCEMLAGLPSSRTTPRTSTSSGTRRPGSCRRRAPRTPPRFRTWIVSPDVDRLRHDADEALERAAESERAGDHVAPVDLGHAARSQLEPVVDALLHQRADGEDVAFLRLDVRRDLDLPGKLEARGRGGDLVERDLHRDSSLSGRRRPERGPAARASCRRPRASARRQRYALDSP